MFHLFNKVYIDAEWHVSSKYNFVLLTKERKEHPLSRVLGFQVEPTTRIEDYLNSQHHGSIENFWTYLLQIEPQKKFVIYLDEELYLDFILQYWKSLYPNSSINHIANLFHFHKKDLLLKSLAYADRGDNHLGNNYHLFSNLSEEALQSKIKSTKPSETLLKMNKEIVSVEYILGDYLFNNQSSYAESLKSKILNMCWQNWCRNIQDLKAEYIRGFDNLHLLVPSLTAEQIRSNSPIDIIKATPDLAWLLDEHITPTSTRYIMKTYPPDFFTKKQEVIDKFEKVNILINNLSLDEVKIFDDTAKTTELYSSDFASILDKDIQAVFSNRIFNGDLFLVVNHVLVNYLYTKVRNCENRDLKDFALE
ncbi:MAG: hypothetical protein ACK4VO_06805 [Pseudobdellovibrio sp.]